MLGGSSAGVRRRPQRPSGAARGRRTRALALGAAGACALLSLASASPALATYAATYHAECCHQTLESGEQGSSWFEFVNTGTSVWYPGGLVRLGTSTPSGGTGQVDTPDSPFYVPGRWISPKRPTALDAGPVAPGGIGRFTFPIYAPPVATSTTFRQYFEPLYENVNWMHAVVFLDYTVVPAAPPTVIVTGLSAHVHQGDAVAVSAHAVDNHAVDHVTFAIGGVSRTVRSSGSTYSTTLSSASVPLGAHLVTATAVDRAGNSARASAVFFVGAPRDYDNDGLAGAADRCPTRRGGRYDRDHDGCPGPYRTMSPRIHARWVLPARGVRFHVFYVSRVPSRGRVSLVCASCHIREAHRLRARPRHHIVTLSRIVGPLVRPRAAVVVRVSAPGYIGRYLYIYVVPHGHSRQDRKGRRQHHPFKRRTLCMPAGSNRPALSCPIRP